MKLSIIGVGDDGLNAVTAAARERILGAEKLLGDERALSLLGEAAKGQRVPITGDLEQVAAQIEALGNATAAMVVFGDPMFYGLARFLTDRFGKDRFEVLPHVSSMQLAFARVMESWDEAYLTDVSQHPLPTIVDRIRTAQKVGLFTTDRVGPAQVAQSLLNKRVDYFTAYVCENLGARDERVTRGELSEIATGDFGALNVMILIRKPDAPDRPRDAIGRRLFGNPDDAFLQAKPKQGLLTPAEIRSLALAQMDIAPGSIVWDVGAGSGSVSVEAAQLAVDGAVYAIEMDPEDHELITKNAERFGAGNVLPILGKAPDAWKTLPDPDCVFIAGAGREVINLATAAYGRLRSGGRLVVNMIAIDNLAAVRSAILEAASGSSATGDVSLNVWMVNIARGADQLERLTFEAVKPNFLLAAVKG
ncbi:precorrin-6y C5,15-methyltransferase (decarboxylating) subunit CbiE [Botrimarina hoheduenensis]|uniref:Precorrin-6Y C(5,15)-methyltransferase [decarboxylating] n=1 Tax=Botrimarina hoheduenensis TaxID=2528000 RepID=A0A5C5WCQ5_9BACT|nr:precorrin-6y C5,15-methyltransferase (decarboxylating) subunit CbiE [Botrimarina hoheduenensis]TWT47819.1 Precorrin-6Y C(5,15)-methyltransferase [decarboxylating] [Botrimarina hoheduenensis]